MSNENKNNQNEEKELINPVTFYNKEDLTEDGLIIPVTFEEKKGPEDKQYLILFVYYGDEGEDEYTGFEFVTGRTATRNMIKDSIDYIDIHESKVLVEGVALEGMISVYDFMKYVEIYFEDDAFDIEDYNIGDDAEDQDNNVVNKSMTDKVEQRDAVQISPLYSGEDQESEEYNV